MRRDTQRGREPFVQLFPMEGFDASLKQSPCSLSAKAHRSHSLNLSALNRLWVMRTLMPLCHARFSSAANETVSPKVPRHLSSYLITVWLR